MSLVELADSFGELVGVEFAVLERVEVAINGCGGLGGVGLYGGQFGGVGVLFGVLLCLGGFDGFGDQRVWLW